MDALLANAPFLLLFLLCPLMMLFMHRGSGHDAHGVDHTQHHADGDRESGARSPGSSSRADR